MLKLVVFSALVAIAASKPSGVHISHLEVPLVHAAVPVVRSAIVPAAVSSSHRVDVHQKSVVVAESPVHVVADVPVVAETPVIEAHAVAPVAVSKTHRVDVHQKSVIVADAPAVSVTHIHEAPVIAARYAAPLVVDTPVVAHSVVSPLVATHAVHDVHHVAHSGLFW